VIFKIDFEKAYDSARWDFVEKVLQKKGFDSKIKDGIISTVRGGGRGQSLHKYQRRQCTYFKTHRGLRQGDPLSPLLFNLATDALALMLDEAKQKGYIKGVVSHLVPGGHLQYADDTILMCDCDEKSISNVKFLLYCFKWMLGLKINIHKSEVVASRVTERSTANS
jgi:hypothetical protein